MNQVERQFAAEIGPLALGKGLGMIDRDTNFPGEFHGWIPGKGNDVGRGGILHEIRVQPTDPGIVEEDNRQLPDGGLKVVTGVEGAEKGPDLSRLVAELAVANLAPQVDLSWPCHDGPRFSPLACRPDSRSGYEACLKG